MDTPLQLLLPIAGFMGGIILWSRVAYLVIAIAGLTPDPTKPPRDSAALLKACRRIVLLMAAGWLAGIGTVLAYMLFAGSKGWALLFGGMLAVPLLTVTNFFRTIQGRRGRATGVGPGPVRNWLRAHLSTRRGVMLFCLLALSVPMSVVFLRFDYLDDNLDASQALWILFVCLAGGALMGAFMWYAIVRPLTIKLPKSTRVAEKEAGPDVGDR